MSLQWSGSQRRGDCRRNTGGSRISTLVDVAVFLAVFLSALAIVVAAIALAWRSA
jgi:hypothetical protein